MANRVPAAAALRRVRRAVHTGGAAGDVAYVGDGYSDRCAALSATRVFATGALARHLAEHGIPYEPFEDLRDVLDALSGKAVAR